MDTLLLLLLGKLIDIVALYSIKNVHLIFNLPGHSLWPFVLLMFFVTKLIRLLETLTTKNSLHASNELTPHLL